jgi:hypothetical protein
MKRLFSILLGGLLLSATLAASAAGDRTPSSTSPPIITWQAPAFYTSPHSGRTALTDAAPPMPYIPLVPCREYDSRNTTALANNTPRTVTLSGAPCGIPTTAVAVAVNITVFNITGAGSNGVFQVGTVSPTSAWINYPSYETQRANAGVLSTTGAAAIVVQVNQGAGSVDFVVDVFGWYGPVTTSGPFNIQNAAAGSAAIVGDEYGTSGIGVYGFTSGAGGTGVFGFNSTATGFGVIGSNTAGIGVKGTSTAPSGVTYGVVGTSSSTTAGASGVFGNALGTANDTQGVFGADGASAAGALVTNWFSAGVRGQGKNGVIGITNTSLGDGVIGVAIAPATVGVRVLGDFTATGGKFFIEPHPTDPRLVIRYVALEGPEAGTYFRGTAKTVNHEAVIQVPDSFRMVTAEDGLTVQLTPVGELAQMAVMSQDLNQIVVRSSRDVTFHYHVNGVRHALRDLQVVAEDKEFRPISPDQKMPGWLTEDAKSRLISNGTYNPDGTVNMATAERLGWVQAWREDAAAAAAARK